MDNPFNRAPMPDHCLQVDTHDHTLVPVRFLLALEDGKHSLPCDAFAAQTVHTTSGQVYVLVQMSHLGLVLHEAFTPEGVRLIANTLLRSADEAEAAMLETSNAQLGAVLANGKSA